MRKKLPLIASLLIGVLLVTAAAPLSYGSNNSGFLTSQPAMLRGIPENVSITPLLSVGDELSNGYRFESLPDGIAIDLTGTDSFDVYVNHETSTVPFRGAADFTNSMLSKLVLRRGNGNVLDGAFVIPSSANYLRFCSNFYAGAAEGFEIPLVLTNEETNDMVNRTGIAWPPGPGAEQAGVVVAYNPASGTYRSIYGMGRHNHENSVAIPGYGEAVVLSGDDTFNAPSSQVYMYIADNAQAVWDDQGHLYALRSDDPVFNDYGDLAPGMSVSGSFIPVPDSIADGDQNALENWSNANNVFQFIRVEDIAYDKNTPNVVYFADTGEPRAIPDPITGRLRRGPSGTQGPYPNGRIFKMTLDTQDPTIVSGLEVLVDGDAFGAAGAGMLSLIHNPDNIETTPWSLMIQEDPGSQNSYAPGDPNGTTARIWRYDLVTGELSVVAVVDQSADPAALMGDWESSGIVDASAMFGRGAFLVAVQAHTLYLETNIIPNPLGGTITQKREAGQLLLVRIPGS
jgi:hypothetical protein